LKTRQARWDFSPFGESFFADRRKKMGRSLIDAARYRACASRNRPFESETFFTK